MNIKTAREILNVSDKATAEEIKKSYRNLSKKFHPDINKEPGADDKFKKINEAFSILSGKTNSSGLRERYQPSHISQHIKISFKESVLGCKKEIQYDRVVLCPSCNGNGKVKENNGCKKCGGRGQSVKQQGNMTFIQTCEECMGRAEVRDCDKCFGECLLETNATVSVNVPGGVTSSSILRLANIGNFVQNTFMGPQHTDVHVQLEVTPEEGLNIVGNDVVSEITIPMIEAMIGKSIEVNTIYGMKKVDIKPLSKNKEEIVIDKFGVGGVGVQRVILNVPYPENTDKLLEYLQGSA